MDRQPSPKDPARVARALARSAAGLRRFERAVRRMEELDACRSETTGRVRAAERTSSSGDKVDDSC